VTLAKAKIVNSTILKSLIRKDPTIVSLLKAAKIRAKIQSENIIHIIIAYPRVEVRCKKVSVYPVSQHSVILRLDKDTLVECEEDTFKVTECPETTHNTFCERETRPNVILNQAT